MRPSLSLLKRSVWKGTLEKSCSAFLGPPRQLEHNISPAAAGWPNIVPFPQLRPAGSGKAPPVIKTQARAASILPSFVGLRFAVHNGKIYQEIYITEEMVGRKLGEFVATRKRFSYKQTKNK
ncbi:hypothetical protein ABEF95_014370 [Exophiala dermatitidis]